MKRPPIVCSANALDGHGKTSFLLTAPKPIWLAHIDPNTREVVDKAIDSGEIEKGDVQLQEVPYPATIFGKKGDIEDEAYAAWADNFIEPLRLALDDDDVATIGLDTGTELAELLLMSRFGRTVQILPEMRTKTNYEYKGLLQALKRSGKHVVILHRLKDVWKSAMVETKAGKEERRDKVDGMYEREGFNKTGYHVNVEVYLSFLASRGGSTANQYGMRVGRCLQRPGLVTAQPDEVAFWDKSSDDWWWGKEKIDGERIKCASFTYLALKMFPDSKPEDWR